MTWNTNIDEAPKGRTVMKERKTKKGIVQFSQFESEKIDITSPCGQVMVSYWIPEGGQDKRGRWLGLATGEKPQAWQPRPEPYCGP
jgi:hypothetical protein